MFITDSTDVSTILLFRTRIRSMQGEIRKNQRPTMPPRPLRRDDRQHRRRPVKRGKGRSHERRLPVLHSAALHFHRRLLQIGIQIQIIVHSSGSQPFLFEGHLFFLEGMRGHKVKFLHSSPLFSPPLKQLGGL